MYVEIGLLLNAVILGVMTSFIVVTSPAVFKTLDEDHSKKFLRYIFPRLFNFCFLISMFMFLFFSLGDFVFGMTEAYLIENGKLSSPIRDGNLIGNGPQALLDIDAIAKDFAMGSPGTCGKDGQGVPVGDGTPTLRVKRLTVGGTAT